MLFEVRLHQNVFLWTAQCDACSEFVRGKFLCFLLRSEFKGTVHPEIKNAYFFSFTCWPFIHPDRFDVRDLSNPFRCFLKTYKMPQMTTRNSFFCQHVKFAIIKNRKAASREKHFSDDERLEMIQWLLDHKWFHLNVSTGTEPDGLGCFWTPSGKCSHWERPGPRGVD